MSGIPDTWTWTTVNTVSMKVTDGTHHSPKNFATGEYMYLTAKNVRVGRLELDNITYIPKQVHDEIYSRCDVRLDDVLLVKDGVNTGMSAVNTLNEPFSLLSSVGVIRPTTCLSPYYLAHWFNGPAARKIMADQVAGVAITRLTLEKINAFPIPLAPRHEQDRIVAALDERLSELDASVASLERAERNLVRYRAAVLAAACSGTLVPTEADLARREGRSYEPADQLLARILAERRKANTKAKYEEPAQPDTRKLPKLPEGWAWATIDSLSAEVRNGLGMPPHADSGAPILRISAVRSGRVDVGEVRYLGVAPEGSEQYRLLPGDLLFTRYNGTKELVGACGCVPESGAGLYYPDKLIRVRMLPNGAIPNYVMLAAGTGEAAKHVWSHLRTTAGQVGIAGQDVKSIPIPLPPLAEQERIIAEVDRHLSRADALAASIAQAKRRAQRLRRAILTAAFQGRLVPQDPNDEPASVLLERIRAQAAAEPAAPARGRGRRAVAARAAEAAITYADTAPRRRGRPSGSKNRPTS